jgi:hypothetical protein
MNQAEESSSRRRNWETKNGGASSAALLALWHTDKRRAGLSRQKNHGADLSRRQAEICGDKTLEAKKQITQQNKIWPALLRHERKEVEGKNCARICVRPKCQADLLKQKFQEEKYNGKIKTENEIAEHSAAELALAQTIGRMNCLH